MTLRGKSWAGALFPVGVLLAAMVICALILWGGPRLISAVLFLLGTSSAPLEETIASMIIFGLLLVTAAAGGAATGINPFRLGWNAGLRLAQGAAIGLLGLLVAVTLAGIAGVLRPASGTASAAMLIWGTALIMLQAGSEEVVFRGWLQPILVKAWGGWGVLVTAGAFAALHLLGSAKTLISIVNLLLGGLLFGLLAKRYQGIASAVAAHFAWNWSEQLLLGLDPNPGVGTFGSVWDAELIGSSWWGGSGEGLNASIAMTFALAILLAPLLIVSASGHPERAPRRSDPAPA